MYSFTAIMKMFLHQVNDLEILKLLVAYYVCREGREGSNKVLLWAHKSTWFCLLITASCHMTSINSLAAARSLTGLSPFLVVKAHTGRLPFLSYNYQFSCNENT